MISKNLNSNKIKKLFLCEDDATAEKIISYLSNKFGFSKISNVLTIYYENNLKMVCDVNEIKIMSGRTKTGADSMIGYKIQTKYFGSTIQTFARLGLVKGNISCVSSIIFPNINGVRILYKKGTLISKHYFKLIYKKRNRIFDSVVLKMIKESTIRALLNDKIRSVEKEIIVDRLGVPNKKIIEFCTKNNLSWAVSSTVNYFHSISSMSNDYSDWEDCFKLITRQAMNSVLPSPVINFAFFKNVTIVIPCYNPGESILKTLKSIDKQVPKLNVEVIIVDDASKIPVSKMLEKANLQLSFIPLIVRNENNAGSANSRNLGSSLSKKDILIFLDSDVVLTPNYVYEHVLRHMILGKAVCVSFKENVDLDDKRITCDAIEKGVKLPKYEKDLRLLKYQNKHSLGYYKDCFLNSEGSFFSILADSNYFKKMSYGRKFGVFDLPSMVISHNVSVKSSCFKRVDGFEKSMTGYGLEDAQFGIKMISDGAYVVPVLNCGVYHIDHKARRGSRDRLRREFMANSKKVNHYLFEKC
jgi:glycosyltransferase involved in cell wall biosynthesis